MKVPLPLLVLFSLIVVLLAGTVLTAQRPAPTGRNPSFSPPVRLTPAMSARAAADEARRGHRYTSTGKWVITDGKHIWKCNKTYVEFNQDRQAWRFSDDDHNLWHIPLGPDVKAVKLHTDVAFDDFLRKNLPYLLVGPVPETRGDFDPVPETRIGITHGVGEDAQRRLLEEPAAEPPVQAPTEPY